MSEEFTWTFVCVSCGQDFTKTYPSERSMQCAKSKKKYCPACARERKLEMQRSIMREHNAAKKAARSPQPSYAPALDDQKDLKEINQKCNAFLAKHGDLQKPGAFYIPKEDRAPAEVMQYGDAAADRYKRLMEKKTKKGESQ